MTTDQSTVMRYFRYNHRLSNVTLTGSVNGSRIILAIRNDSSRATCIHLHYNMRQLDLPGKYLIKYLSPSHPNWPALSLLTRSNAIYPMRVMYCEPLNFRMPLYFEIFTIFKQFVKIGGNIERFLVVRFLKFVKFQGIKFLNILNS